MFEPMCGRDIATLAVASTKMEFVETPARSQGTHDKPARESRTAFMSIQGKARPEDRVAFSFVNQFYLLLFWCHWCVSWAKTLSCCRLDDQSITILGLQQISSGPWYLILLAIEGYQPTGHVVPASDRGEKEKCAADSVEQPIYNPKPASVCQGGDRRDGNCDLEHGYGKIVHPWAFEGNLPEPFECKSNLFELEWPPRSGKYQKFPEVDQACFFSDEITRRKLKVTQVLFLDRLRAALGG
jgi:predicted NUDIX family NTP pyrophosphohydrolase